MRFKVNDIVTTAPGWSRAIFVITALHPENPKNQYVGTNPLTGKSYRFADSGLADKRIGVADVVDILVHGENQVSQVVTDQLFQLGQHRAQREVSRAKLFGKADPRWEILAKLASGDKLTIIRNGREEMVTFKNVIPQGAKYIFAAANSNGTSYRYPLEVIKANLPKRTEDQIKGDINDLSLS